VHEEVASCKVIRVRHSRCQPGAAITMCHHALSLSFLKMDASTGHQLSEVSSLAKAIAV
jgi:hypothetical protein